MTYLNASSRTCQFCPFGTYSDVGSSFCNVCGVGSYLDGINCQICEAAVESGATTCGGEAFLIS